MTASKIVFEAPFLRRGGVPASDPSEGAAPPPGRVPRVSRLMALAIRFDGLIRRGAIADYATLAQLGDVSRARITQIMNLLYLASDIQEDVLYLPRVTRGRDPIVLRDLQAVASRSDWAQQRLLWRKMFKD